MYWGCNMATIAENLLELQQTKSNIKSAIEGKGQDLTDVPFTQYGEKISAIQTKEDLDTELNEQDTLLAELQSSVDELQEKPLDRFQLKCDTTKTLQMEFYWNNSTDVYTDEIVTQIMRGIDTSKVISMANTFGTSSAVYGLYTDLSNITLDMSNCEKANGMFVNQNKLTKPPKIINANKLNNTNGMYVSCNSITEVPYVDMSNVTSASNMHYSCVKLTSVPEYNLSNVRDLAYFLGGCSSLTSMPSYSVDNANNLSYFAQQCSKIKEINIKNTQKGLQFTGFAQGCSNLVTVKTLDLINASSVGSMFTSCANLTNLTLKNIKKTIQIGSGTSWGHLLTLESLLNTVKELHTNTTTSTRTLTMGTANLEKLANVYVKLIDITDDMRAEDEYIDNKAPFVQCESTDDGAMLITDYVTTVKNWQLA